MTSRRSDDIPPCAFSIAPSRHILYVGTWVLQIIKGQASGQGDAIKASVQRYGASW